MEIFLILLFFSIKSLFPVESCIFYCTCFVRDAHSQVTKLDPNSLKCVFFGYSRLQKGRLEIPNSDPPPVTSLGDPVPHTDHDSDLDLPIALRKVIAVPNGLQAWKMLEDLNNHIDIVLTEVVVPTLSGIGLLCKITSHKTLKNIPVIMMSSHDSMGIVFKCLSKGAVGFLVKPIRKNELKNLWQHIWRRCHSVSSFTFVIQRE
ncbi:two-component response regulator-like APRR7 [Hevea brasiliensis]|uniref:two-component response regulator-like APRR7 n=1 Tax=Hevea brasiliensis TaxID=3981 RepID=UPI0025D69DF9|nr:two-component response regulator-like APRR7 [Hevea brasiliensis]